MTMELAVYEGSVKDLPIVYVGGGLKTLEVAPGEMVPLFDSVPLWATFIQPGSIKNNKALKGKAGHFFFRAYEGDEDEEQDPEDVESQFSEVLRLLPIGMMGYNRALMPEWDDVDKDPICSSGDGIWPRAKIEVPRSTQCGTWELSDKGKQYIKDLCPDGQWVDGVRPVCKKKQNFAFFDIDRKCPIILPLSGTSISGFNSLNKKLSLLQLKAVTKGTSLTDYFIKVRGEDKGTYMQMQFTFAKAEDVDPGKYLCAVAWYQENVLPVLGINPEKPEENDQGTTPTVEMSEEDVAALDKAEAEVAHNFQV